MPDYLGNTGGMLSSKQVGNTFTLEDLWDIQPLLDANREGLIPKKLKSLLANKKESDIGTFWEYKDWVPDWFKNFDPTEIIGKGPFRNITTIKATPLSKEQRLYKEPLDKARNRIAESIFD